LLTLYPNLRTQIRKAIPAIICFWLVYGAAIPGNLGTQESVEAGRYDVLVQTAAAAESAGKRDQAIAALEKALTLKPSSALVEIKLANLYSSRKEFEKSLEYSSRALTAEPRNVDALRLAGMAAGALNKPDVAAKYFRQAVAIKGTDPELHYRLGMSLYSLRDARHALDEFYRARLYDPKDAENLYMIGKIHWEMCRQVWEEMVRVDPNSVRVKQMVAEQDEIRNLYPEAIAKYQEIIRQEPAALGFNYALGKLYLHIAKIDEAEQAFQAELKLDPNSPLAYYGLAQAALERQNLPLALATANRAIQVKPDFGDAYILLGRIELGMGDKQKAIELLEHAAILSPSDPSLFYMLGRAYTDLGKRDSAARALSTYQKLKGEQEKEIQVAR
jgi:tetratricopeptide (TPR) repeat protein